MPQSATVTSTLHLITESTGAPFCQCLTLHPLPGRSEGGALEALCGGMLRRLLRRTARVRPAAKPRPSLPKAAKRLFQKAAKRLFSKGSEAPFFLEHQTLNGTFQTFPQHMLSLRQREVWAVYVSFWEFRIFSRCTFACPSPLCNQIPLHDTHCRN